ncbi:hypothetical protein K1719_007235 [Acacia pycnantha]|nr:hypothetical protein K1719_007235 [Acacia pycnantha]
MSARQGPGDASSLNIVLQDIHGDRVHASMRSRFIHRHNKHLEEVMVVEVSNFFVVPAIRLYQPTEHRIMSTSSFPPLSAYAKMIIASCVMVLVSRLSLTSSLFLHVSCFSLILLPLNVYDFLKFFSRHCWEGVCYGATRKMLSP